ncbi:uncharacterized protein YALI1_D07335g [Yarrowia lipolytica]|uniref:Uncharacterized protein n=1 Tax=Yarrowia lipolytica TaxID=4952 RepID=A0A1D8NDC7_YARLL|nr:hypothetical protein YALI1_D07335g [Yarrowia lipolytica]
MAFARLTSGWSGVVEWSDSVDIVPWLRSWRNYAVMATAMIATLSIVVCCRRFVSQQNCHWKCNIQHYRPSSRSCSCSPEAVPDSYLQR